MIVFAGLTLLVAAVFWQTVGFEFINFDDNVYIYQNPPVAGGLTRENIHWALTAVHSANWHPLTWISHQLDATLFGLNAGSHHATNILLHLVNTILAFIVFKRLSGCFWKSALVAALFAVHPAHVESVAWVSERKDVLSTCFWLLTMLAYSRYAEGNKDSESQNPKSKIRNPKSLILTCLLFAIGLTAKPMLVTLPFVLLLMDFWPLGRWKTRADLPRLLLEKTPLFLLSIASSVITVIAQKTGGAVQTLEMLPFGTRFFNAVLAYGKYLLTLFYPVGLAPWYPYEKDLPVGQIVLSGLVLAGITFICLRQMRKRPYLFVGWFWFIGTLVPVIGLVQVGLQSMADRYTYIPFFGLFLMIVWGGGDLIKSRSPNKTVPVIISLAIVLALSVLSFRQVSFWRNDETLYRHSIAVTEGNFLMMQNYCHALILEDRIDEAEKQCRDSIAANPVYPEAHNSLGIIQMRRAQFEAAAESFRRAIASRPDFAMYKVNLATALAQTGKPEEAERLLRAAAASISFKENTAVWLDAIKNLGIAYARQKNYAKAGENFIRAIGIAPENPDLRLNYALTLFAEKKYDEARTQIEESIKRKPDQAEAFNLYGLILVEQNQRELAVRQFEKALRMNPGLAEARENLRKLNVEEDKK
ncbi:MAG: tetratricopeptide repeat protein [Pyrinomonadaceae bacterium]